ncbi:MAG: maleylpyruvate isomerase family mycothiol-dependent enzyme [Actinomycetota bacterium]
MDVSEYVEQLRLDGKRLADVASSTDLAAPVPSCPDWQVRDLVRHVGGVHRWATGFVLGVGQQPPDGDLERFVGGWPQDADLVAWFRAGYRALVEALASAPADLETWTFLDAPSPLEFWACRQAHETAIHRVDAEAAAGDVTGFPSAFAADGVDELLLRFASRPGRTLQVASPRSMVVHAADEPRSWHVRFAPSGFQIQADPTEPDAELVVSGNASDLYLLLWNRRDTTGLELDGEPDLLDLWRETVQLNWT